jgi:(p)ppGpp synthase/HD superfamily hydrolase
MSNNEFKRLQRLLAKAIRISATGHEKQFDKGGKAYILHPLRLMFAIPAENIKAQILAVLHDVVEDTDWTIEALRKEGFNDDILEALELLTHDPNLSYAEYIRAIKENPLATIVKKADLTDNSDITRLKGLREKDFTRLDKYFHAFAFLDNRIDEMPDKW